jgi:hypothetical protein
MSPRLCQKSKTMYRNFIFITFALATLNGRAQERPPLPTYAIDIRYSGDMATHPGITGGIERMFHHEKFQLGLRFNIGGYNHIRNHDALISEIQVAFRYVQDNGLMLELIPGFGIMQTFYNGDGVFDVYEQNKVRRLSRRANPDLTYSLSLGVGIDRQPGPDMKVFYFRPKIFWQYPFNGFALRKYMIEAGMIKTIN